MVATTILGVSNENAVDYPLFVEQFVVRETVLNDKALMLMMMMTMIMGIWFFGLGERVSE